MERIPELKARIVRLFASQYFAVLATRSGARLHTSLVAFAVTEDLASIYFSTPRATRKLSNLLANPEVSLLVDDRSNEITDIYRVTGVTVSGRAEELGGEEKSRALALYLEKHPYLEGFARSPNSALVRIRVRTYDVVSSFQNVMVLAIEGGDE